MDIQDTKVLNETEQALMDALARLADGAPTLPEYKKKLGAVR